MKSNKIKDNTAVKKQEPAVAAGNTVIQPKLTVGASNDPYEKEADAMADKVMRMPEQNFVQRKCAECEKEDEKKLHRKALSDSITPFIQAKSNSETSVPDSVSSSIQNSKGKGSSLDRGIQYFMENRFGTDFSSVKIHTGSESIQMNRKLNAKAFTNGNDIYFNEGQYQPNSSNGKQLLAHELTHTIQQGNETVKRKPVIQLDAKEDTEFLKTKPPDAIFNPFLSDEETKKEQEQYDKDKSAYDEKLREIVLAPLFGERGGDAIFFLNRLRSLTWQQSRILLRDKEFFRRLHKIFKGKSIWVIFTILYFNNKLREPFLRLYHAMMNDDARLFTDMLSIVILHNKDDLFYDLMREIVQEAFAGNVLLKEILRLIDHRSDAGISNRFDGTYEEVHYKQNAAGAYELQKFGGTLSANAYFSGSELRVIVRMHFVNGDDEKTCPDEHAAACSSFLFTGESDPYYDKWRQGMTSYWNNKFSLGNGKETFNITFVPLFITEKDNEAVNIRVITDESKKCNASSSPGQSNEGCWFIKDKDEGMPAHEFGHILGASDEYKVPGSFKEVKDAGFALSDEDMKLTTVEGIRGTAKPKIKTGYDIRDSVMNDDSKNVQPWHLTRLVRMLNAKLPPGTAPFVVKKK